MDELTIGQRIAAKRKELGLSQAELGEKMNVSRQSVSKWEADAALPEIDKLIALSKLYGVSVGWLLGVEPEGAPAREPEQTFSQQEWDILDRLAQQKPLLPRWLVPLAAGVTAVSLIAAFLSGAALYSNHSRDKNIASVSQSVANLTTSLGAGLPDAQVLENYNFLAQPSADLSECTFTFTGVPAYHDPESTAELIVVHSGQTVAQVECQWTGTHYTAEFTLPAYNGYTASFCLTGRDGIVRTSRVYDYLLYNLMDHRGFGDISVDFGNTSEGSGQHTYQASFLYLDEMRVRIDAPEIFRDCTDIWTKCDLVVLGDGKELGRLDLLNRSAYSKKANFSSVNVDFYTKDHVIPIGDVTGIRVLEVLLYCELSNGLQMQKVVETLDSRSWVTD